MSDKLTSFFDSASRKIDLVREVTGSVDAGPLEPREKKFSVDENTKIANLPVAIGGQLVASAQIHGIDKAVSIFEFDNPPSSSTPPEVSSKPLPGSESRPEQASPPRNSAFSEFVLFIGADASTAIKPPTVQPLKIAAEASASGSLRYRLLLPAAAKATRIEAIGALLTSARPPQKIALQQLEAGELHVFDARFKVGFALEAEWGEEYDVSGVVDLFDGISATLKAHAEATVSASMGWSLYDRVQMAVGRVNVSAPEGQWARLRVQRLRRNELTLGAKLALQVDYDIGQAAFAALLDRVLEIEPLQRLFGALDKVEELKLHEIDSAEGWDKIKGKLTGKLEELVLDYVDPKAIIADLPWDKVEPFFQDVSKLVSKYRGLDEKVQSLVGSTLGRVGLEPGSKIRGALDKIAALDPSQLDSMRAKIIKPEFEEAIDLLQLLSGASIEDLVIGSQASKAIEKASALATQANTFLGDLGSEAVGRLHKFTEKSGVDSVISWLGDNATSTTKLEEGLEQRASGKIRGLVQRLTNKAWNKLDEGDLEKIQKWSRSLADLNARREEIAKKLEDGVKKLKGSAGFSVGIEISRLTERAALLDLEVDVNNRAIRDLVESTVLRDLSARELLERLPSPKDDVKGTRKDDETDENLGYRLRDSVFSYRRVRSSSMSVFASLLGIQRKRQTVRIDEEVIRISTETNRQRQATYSTGTVRRLTEAGTKQLAGNHELGVWLTRRVAGRGFNINHKYSEETDAELRVAYSRQDSRTQPEEIEALGHVMEDLGFKQSSGGIVSRTPNDGDIDTEFSLAISFGSDAVQAFLASKDKTQFQVDYRNASTRWLNDWLANRKKEPKNFEGELMARLVRHQKFQGALARGLDFYLGDSGSRWSVMVAGRSRKEAITFPGNHIGRFDPITEVLMRCYRTTKKLEQTVDAYKASDAQHELRPAELRAFGKKFATLLKRTPFRTWPTPLFNLWLLHTRIARKDRNALDGARGLAQLRFRQAPDEPWKTVRWQLVGASRGAKIYTNVMP